jgi:hypothetical protein
VVNSALAFQVSVEASPRNQLRHSPEGLPCHRSGTQSARKVHFRTRSRAPKLSLRLHCVLRLTLGRTLINLDKLEVLYVANVRVEGSNPFARSS